MAIEYRMLKFDELCNNMCKYQNYCVMLFAFILRTHELMHDQNIEEIQNVVEKRSYQQMYSTP